MKAIVVDNSGHAYGPWENGTEAMKALESLGFHRIKSYLESPVDHPTHAKTGVGGGDYDHVRLILLQSPDKFEYFHKDL